MAYALEIGIAVITGLVVLVALIATHAIKVLACIALTLLFVKVPAIPVGMFLWWALTTEPTE